MGVSCEYVQYLIVEENVALGMAVRMRYEAGDCAICGQHENSFQMMSLK